MRELYALRPDRIKVVPGADGWAEAYEYSVGGRSVRFDQLATSVPPILHLTFFHPLDDHYGLAPIEAAAVAVEGGDGNLRYKLSKESAAKTLSFLFQDNFSGRAEIGLTGDDDFHFKVSPDGSTWTEAIIVDKTTGKVTLRGFTDAAASRALLSAAPSDALAGNGMQVNGSFEASQENGTGAVTLTGTGALQTRYLLDGVMAAYRGSFVATAQQVATPFVGGRYALKFTVGTAESSLGANDELTIFIPFEGVRVSRLSLGTANAAYQSLGFWFQAHRTGTYSGTIRNAGKTRSYPFTFTVAAADAPTWVSLSGALAIPGDTTGTWAIDTSVGMYVSICLAGGSSRVGTANAWAGSAGFLSRSNPCASSTFILHSRGCALGRNHGRSTSLDCSAGRACPRGACPGARGMPSIASARSSSAPRSPAARR